MIYFKVTVAPELAGKSALKYDILTWREYKVHYYPQRKEWFVDSIERENKVNI